MRGTRGRGPEYGRPGQGDGQEEPQQLSEEQQQQQLFGSARALGVGYEVAEREVEVAPVDGKRPPWSWSKFWKFTGPGWLMSIAYLDPGAYCVRVQTERSISHPSRCRWLFADFVCSPLLSGV